MNKSKITFNALSAILQVVVVGIVYLILYKFILVQIGIKLLGVWSLVIASTSVASIVNFGISSSIVKFVSTYHTRKRTDLIIKLVFTALIFILLTYTLISILLYFLGIHLLHFAIEEKYIDIAISILPVSLISLIINALSGVFNSAIDGIQKNYVKSYIITLSSIVILFLSFLLTPKYGLYGLVYAQIFQSLIVLFLSASYFKRLFQFDFRWHWDRTLFKEIFNYGIKVQASSILEMTVDPITKFLLTKFGGLAIVGYYEMANRLVLQLRNLIVSANQVLIPVIAELNEIDSDSNNKLYLKLFPIILYLNIILTTIIVVSAPVVSLMWIGHHERIFVNILTFASLGFFFNIISSLAYFNFMGEGKLNVILLSISIGFLVNISLGYLLGFYYGGIGVIIAGSLALVLNSILLFNTYHRIRGMKIIDLISRNDLNLIFGSIIFIFFSNHMYNGIINNSISSMQIILCVTSLMIFVFFILKNNNTKFLWILTKELYKGKKRQKI